MNETTKQLLVAGATAAVTTTVAVLITQYLTKKSIASGDTPLPAGSTPTTTSGVIVATPKSLDASVPGGGGSTATSPPDATPPANNAPPEIAPQTLENAIKIAQAATTYSANANVQPQNQNWQPKQVSP